MASWQQLWKTYGYVCPTLSGEFLENTAPSTAFGLFCPLNFFCHHLHLIFSQINSRDRFRRLLRSVGSAPAQHSWGLSSDCARFVISYVFLPGTQESWPFISEHWGLPEPVTIRREVIGTGWKCPITKWSLPVPLRLVLCETSYKAHLIFNIFCNLWLRVWELKRMSQMQIQSWYSHEELPSLVPCGQLRKMKSDQRATHFIHKLLWKRESFCLFAPPYKTGTFRRKMLCPGNTASLLKSWG